MVGYATSILDDPDMLLMYAQARGDVRQWPPLPHFFAPLSTQIVLDLS